MKNQEKEKLYEQTLPSYVPNKPFTLHFINSNTTENELINLCNVIKNEIHFVLDTELDIHGYVPAIIQLLVMSTSSSSSVMLLIETCFLPTSSSQCLNLIKNLLRDVFRDGTYLYSWGSMKSELEKFERYQLFPSSVLSNLIDVQALFTKWFNSFLMEKMNNNGFTIDDDSLIINVPESTFKLIFFESKINHIKITNNELWSLQDGLAHTLYKYLSKRDTCRSWSIGLDACLSSRNKNYSQNDRQKLIKYASHDCLSLMELIWFIYDQYINHPSRTENYVQTLGEYFSFLKRKFTSSISSSLKNQQQWYDLLFSGSEEDSDDMWTIHDLYERQSSSLNRSFIKHNEQPTAADHSSIESTTANNLLSFQQPTPFDLLASQQITLVDQQVNSQSQVIDSSVLAVDEHPDIPIAQEKAEPKIRRSTEARKCRNQKSSLPHRRTSYRFELQRPMALNITTAKTILHEYDIKYTNVNPVQAVLIIGIKSQQQQQLYDQLLPVDIFART